MDLALCCPKATKCLFGFSGLLALSPNSMLGSVKLQSLLSAREKNDSVQVWLIYYYVIVRSYTLTQYLDCGARTILDFKSDFRLL